MTNDDGRKPEGAPERSPKAGAGAPSDVEGNGPKRFSVRRKLAVVARLLRGEPLELDTLLGADSLVGLRPDFAPLLTFCGGRCPRCRQHLLVGHAGICAFRALI